MDSDWKCTMQTCGVACDFKLDDYLDKKKLKVFLNPVTSFLTTLWWIVWLTYVLIGYRCQWMYTGHCQLSRQFSVCQQGSRVWVSMCIRLLQSRGSMSRYASIVCENMTKCCKKKKELVPEYQYSMRKNCETTVFTN